MPGDISLKNIKINPTLIDSSSLHRIHSIEIRTIAGAGIAGALGYVAWRRRSLTRSGAIGALISGTLTTALGGYGRATLLVGFFTSSSILTRLPIGDGSGVSSYTEKGGQRDVWQVGANGGISTLIACLGSGQRHRLPYLGALAAAAGDTWATEIGRRWGTDPRHILTWERVEPGVSGGITVAGTLATIAGGTFIGALGLASGVFDPAFRNRNYELLLTGAATGIVGSIVDSVAGATIQERRWCQRCQQPTEQKVHHCGGETQVVGGVPGIDNDAVNLICTFSGAIAGWAIERILNRHVREPERGY